MAKRISPSRYSIYELAQVFNDLELLDSPALIVHLDEGWGAIQDSHVLPEDILADPALGATRWKYMRTTDEWIPVFYAEDDMTQFIDHEPYLDFDGVTPIPESLWITLKKHPRSQKE